MSSFIKKHSIALQKLYNTENRIDIDTRKKYLILRIFNKTPEYEKMKEIHLKNEENSIFVTYSSEITDDYEYIANERTLYLRGVESYIPGILIKTIWAIKICMYLFEFDVIIRTNISTVIDHYRLNEVLNSLNGNYIYGGHVNTLCFVDEPGGITSDIFNDIRGMMYISGAALILSKNLCDYLVDKSESLNYDVIDDVSIGLLLPKFFINIESYLVIGPIFDKNAIFYRFRTDEIFGDRETDIKDIGTQYSIIKSNREIYNSYTIVCMDPSKCQLVSPFALISTASHRAPFPISDFGGLDPSWYPNLFPGCILHVCPPALPNFVKKVLPSITVPFKLLTNNSDYTLPKDFPEESELLLQHPLLIHWFAQNCILDHPKLTRVPIGLDYHSLHIPPSNLKFGLKLQQMHPFGWGVRKPALKQEQELLSIRNRAPPFPNRQLKCYANFHFAMTMGYAKTDRPDALNTVPKDLVFYEPTKVTRDICWKNMVQCAFVLSPHGNGLDCHRTWEALSLGSIPIVKTSGLDPLFEGLPVWIVSQWSDVTESNMRLKVEEFSNRSFQYEKLTLKYWQSKIIGA